MSNTGFPARPRGSADDDGAAARPAPDQTLVLAVDTATDARSVCVARGRQILSLVCERQAGAGASLVLPVIDEALRRAGVVFGEVELFGVAAGPGSFTGLRAGIATVKAFAAVSGRPVVPVPTLHAVALSAGASRRTVAALPAGRGEVFAQLLAVSEAGDVRELSGPMHVSPASLVERAAEWGGDLSWAGGGAQAHRELISEAASRSGGEWREPSGGEKIVRTGAGRVWALAPQSDSYSEQVARLSLISSEKGVAILADEVRALYVRPSDAELMERCRV